MTHSYEPRIQHVQAGVSAYDDVSREALEYLSGAVRQMASCPHLCNTKATMGELQKTADYLAQLKLEADIFANASQKWRDKFTQREIVTQRQALLNAKNKLTDPGGQFLARYRANLDKANLYCTTNECAHQELIRRNDQDDGIGWTDTSVREAHAWAESQLRDLNEELAPLAEAARKRMGLYLDELNITDRYAGYRNNMGYMRRRDPNDTEALDNAMSNINRPSLAPRWHLGLDWMRAAAVDTQNYLAPGDSNDCKVDQRKFMERYDIEEDPRKMAGIEPNFPGRSEYQDSYRIPALVESATSSNLPPSTHRATFEQPPGVRGRGETLAFDSSQVQSKGYNINPTPNYLSEFSKGNYEPLPKPISETHESFTWPECTSIESRLRNSS